MDNINPKNIKKVGPTPESNFTRKCIWAQKKFGPKKIPKKSKFWNNDNSSSSSIQGNSTLSEHIETHTCENKAKSLIKDKDIVTFDVFNQSHRKSKNGYWPKHFLDEQTTKWEKFLSVNYDDILKKVN